MQLLLPLPIEPLEYHRHDFITSTANIEAYKAIVDFKIWPDNRILIVGEHASGKTHLAKIWQQQRNAQMITSIEDMYHSSGTSNLIIENIESLKSENLIFHAINHALENSINLLMTANYLPKFYLKDLSSRINATHKILIRHPDDMLMKCLIFKYFMNKQVHVDSEVMDYLISRIKRSYTAIINTVHIIDEFALREKRNITIPLVRQALEKFDLCRPNDL